MTIQTYDVKETQEHKAFQVIIDTDNFWFLAYTNDKTIYLPDNLTDKYLTEPEPLKAFLDILTKFLKDGYACDLTHNLDLVVLCPDYFEGIDMKAQVVSYNKKLEKKVLYVAGAVPIKRYLLANHKAEVTLVVGK